MVQNFQMSADLYHLMEEAVKEAAKGAEEGEVPVGAVVAAPGGEIIARAHNRPISMNDPTAHAEVLALRAAGFFCRNYRLEDATLAVTVEPCPMCVGAALNARISRLVFGAFDRKSGAAGSLYNLAQDPRLNHRITVVAGILEEECADLMRRFFKNRREKNGEVPKWS